MSYLLAAYGIFFAITLGYILVLVVKNKQLERQQK